MKFTFVEIKHMETGNWGFEYYQKNLTPVMLDQLKIAVEPHASSYNGNAQKFENVFFPIYPNNEGGIEYVRWYKVMNEHGVHAFDFLRVEVSAGSFFEVGTAKHCFFLWAGKLALQSPFIPETADLLKSWETIDK